MDSALHNLPEMTFSQEEWVDIYEEMRTHAIYSIPVNHINFENLS